MWDIVSSLSTAVSVQAMLELLGLGRTPFKFLTPYEM